MTDLTVKNIFFTDESVKINWFNSEKYSFTDESVKRQITDSISENLTDSYLESIVSKIIYRNITFNIRIKMEFNNISNSVLFCVSYEIIPTSLHKTWSGKLNDDLLFCWF